ncbi:MAG: hypothetical protein Ct9H300mP1_09510 [Planctomycetaceae bacterium]|nr:MAG: hypothetical protein Ct9H300mP1_09510 [Planctomycetaceae bacterium]
MASGPRRRCSSRLPPRWNSKARKKTNQWVGDQVALDTNNRGIFFIHPEDDPEWVRQEVRRLGLHGLKCYHTMSNVEPTWDADIQAFLPEP